MNIQENRVYYCSQAKGADTN